MTGTQRSTAILAGLCLMSGFMSGIPHFDLGWAKLSIVNVCAVLILLISLWELIRHPKPEKLLAVSVLIGFFIISTLVSERVFSALKYNIIVLSNVLLVVAFAGACRSSDQHLAKIGKIGLIFGAGLVAAYFLQVHLIGKHLVLDPANWNRGDHLFRITHGSIFAFQGLSHNPNVILVPFVLSFILVYGVSLRTPGAFLSLLLILVVALLSSSRGNWAIAGLFLMGLAFSRPSVLLVLLSLASLLGVSIMAIAPTLLTEQAWSVGRKLASSVDPRLQKWSETFELYLAHPWMGAGGGGVRDTLGVGAENGYLEWLAQYGLIGSIIAVLIVIIAISLHLSRVGWRATGPVILLLTIAGMSNAFNSAFVHPATMLFVGLALTLLPMEQYRNKLSNTSVISPRNPGHVADISAPLSPS